MLTDHGPALRADAVRRYYLTASERLAQDDAIVTDDALLPWRSVGAVVRAVILSLPDPADG